jgi:hypothetical protein
VKRTIDAVQQEIKEVEACIKGLEKKKQTTKLDDDENEDLQWTRNDLGQLREKENLLREEKILLEERLQQSRDASGPLFFVFFFGVGTCLSNTFSNSVAHFEACEVFAKRWFSAHVQCSTSD